ncbi:MAG: dihydroorotate dehydrogenase [Clostridiales bacterium]|nr:dihydroorotate dehydrogenase [Clostridiales bacterium]
MNMNIDFCGISMKNPLTTASGTFNPRAHADFYDLSTLGAVTVKGVASAPWEGNPTPRIAEVYGGMLNSVGLQNPGAEAWIREELPFLQQYDTRIIVNLCGHTLEEYMEVTRMFQDVPVDLFELNISCPNVSAGGVTFGTDPKMVEKVVSSVKKEADKPLIVKLTPNVTDITEIARAAEAGGADALSLINTLLGMKIDIYRRKPVLARTVGGFSGPAIKPVAVRMIYQVAKAVGLPIIGMGGVMTGEDVAEFIMAGASMVAIGTAALVDPSAPPRILQELEAFCAKTGVQDINEIRGII